jgi:hypothetical protein
MVSNIAVFQFMLTVVLIMLTDASFIDIDGDSTSYFRNFFRGNQSDFNVKWYLS